jgi:eukaryotic-like serine/threonine-protein kinase
MQDELNFYLLKPEIKKILLEKMIGHGTLVEISEGMCGEIYIFDQGIGTYPRYVCAKIPKIRNGLNPQEAAQRFVAEMNNQLKFYRHPFVHWAYDFKELMKVPVALFRYWGSDLDKLIQHNQSSEIEKYSILVYICEGLEHCYARGLVSHQDLKPQNIFIRDIKSEFTNLPQLDIYKRPLIADFGLSNASIDIGIYDGARPYMAPEQWNQQTLSPATDIFALGVIFYQLLSGGLHPVGIKLHEYWPNPLPNISKKWTRPEEWKKWSCNGAKINDPDLKVSNNSLALIREMLSHNPNNRPNIGTFKTFLLTQIKLIDEHSFLNVNLLREHFNKFSSNESLEKSWPSLFDTWNWFQERFSGKSSV